MMLDYIKENEIATKIRKVVAEIISEGKVKTYDMMKMRGTATVVNEGAASTVEMAAAIIAKLK